MAEVIGVLSGGVTLATLVVQLTKSIIQIKDCWGQIRDAPEDLKQLVRELEIFRHVLSDIEDDLAKDSVVGVLKRSKHALQSFELCKEAAEDLNAVSRDLIKQVRPVGRARTSYSALKVGIQKGKVDKYRTRLESAIRLLSLSQQCYTRALIQVQPELIAARIMGNGGIGTDSEPTRKFDEEHDSSVPVVRLTQAESMQSSQKHRYSWRLTLPSFVTSKCFELAGVRAYGGWQWVFRTYNTVPSASKSFQLAQVGDIDGLRQLFKSGRASPFDRNVKGQSLVYGACFYNRFEAVQYLLDQGADFYTADDFDSRPIDIVGFGVESHAQDSEPLLPLLRLLVRHLDHDIYETLDDLLFGILRRFDGTEEEFLFLQQTYFPSFYELPQWERIHFAIREMNLHDDPLCNAPKVVRTILNGIPLTTTTLDLEFPEYHCGNIETFTLPLCIALRIGASQAALQQLGAPKSNWQELYESWFGLFREFLENGLDIHQTVGGWTPFLAFWAGYFRPWFSIGVTAECNAAIRSWLRDLQDVGVDLRDFGETEQKIFKDLGGVRQFDSFIADSVGSIQLIGFAHGGSPEDWGVWISEPTDEFVGDFWAMIERLVEMPGGWTDPIHLML